MIHLKFDLLLEFQIQVYFPVTVKNTDSFCFAGHPASLSPELPIEICAQAEKLVLTVLLGDVRAHLKCLSIF